MTVNRCLAALVVVILCFAGYQIWANVHAMQMPAPGAVEEILLDYEEEVDLPPLEQLLSAWRSSPILGQPRARETNGAGARSQPEPRVPWKEYVSENWDLIGLSSHEGRAEAIVFDRLESKMHFVSVGQKVTMKDRELELEEIGGEQIVLTDGTEKITLK